MEAKSAGIDWRLQAAEERTILMLGFGFLRLEGYEKTLENIVDIKVILSRCSTRAGAFLFFHFF